LSKALNWIIYIGRYRPSARALAHTIISLYRNYVLRPAPVVGVFGIIYYIYYAYMFDFATNYIARRGADWELRVCIVVFHGLILLVLTAYLRAVFTVPPEVVYQLPGDVHMERSTETYCARCKGHRPPRTHHCIMCGR
jgi:hypothetical protein